MIKARKTFFIFFALLSISGCARTYWAKDGVTEPQKQKDIAECQYDAKKSTITITNGIEAGFAEGTLFKECLASRGYYRKVYEEK